MAGIFDELTDCAVCFDTMEKAMKLPCDHKFCESCIRQLRNGNSIKCPMDNQIFNFKDVKVDTMHKKWLDRLERGYVSDLKLSGPVCGICEENSCSFRCKTCSKNLCRLCSKGHQKDLENHQIFTIEEYSDELKSHVRLQCQQVEQKIASYEKYINSMSEISQKQQLHIKQWEEIMDDFTQTVLNEASAGKEKIRQTFSRLKHEETIADAKEIEKELLSSLEPIKEKIKENPQQGRSVLEDSQQVYEIPVKRIKTVNFGLEFLYLENLVRVEKRVIREEIRQRGPKEVCSNLGKIYLWEPIYLLTTHTCTY